MNVSRERFRELAAGAGDRPVVVRAEAALDVDVDPLAAYAALTGRTVGDAAPAEYSFLLESAEKTASSDPDGAFRPSDATADRHARYSFVGYDPEAVVTVEPDGTTVRALGEERYADLLRPDDGRLPDGPDGTDGTDEQDEQDGPAGPDALDRLRAAMPDVALAGFPEHDRQQLAGGLVGFLSYDAVYDMWLDEVGLEHPDSRFPDAQFVLTTRTLAFDHLEDAVSLVFTPVVEAGDDAGAVYDGLAAEADRVAGVLADAGRQETGDVADAETGNAETGNADDETGNADAETDGFVREREEAGPRDAYEAAVERAKEHVLDGDIYQGVVSRKRELYGEVDPLALYDALRSVNPSPYMYLLGYDGLHVVGASPETLVTVSGDRVVSNPIAGTCRRGASPVEDRRLAGELLADGKERAEHTMLVDLARNDVRRVAEPGSVRVEEFMNVLKYSHVQHIESTVTGTLAADADAFDATRAAFPAGTLSGAPKIRAMEIIDELEAEPRGPYGGGVGYYSWTGDADVAIVIRTATVEERDDGDRITVQAGAGIVADSDPAAEYAETEQKMDGTLRALERVERDAEASTAGDAEPATGAELDEETPEPEVSR